MEQLKAGPANSSPLTPLAFLERASTVYGDCTSIIYNNITFTWSQTFQRCLQLASSLSQLSLGGQVVSVVAPNVPAMYELQFAVPMSGSILNNVNIRLDAHTISVILRHSESRLVFVDHQSSSLVLEAVALFPSGIPRPLLVIITDDYDDVYVPHAGPSCEGNVCTYKDMVDGGDSAFQWIRPRSEWDPMVLNYTSGTTSQPKGVVHCHRGIFITAVSGLIDWPVPNQPVYLWTLPIFHANGWCFPWGMAAVGGTNVCLRKFDASTIYASIERHAVTHMCGAPVVLNMLSNSHAKQPLKTPVQVLTAGAPPPAAVLSRAESLGFVVSHGYGLTETAGLVVSCAWKPKWNKFPASERARLKARQGVRTACMTEMDVVDPESGKSVERDGLTLGEVVLRGGSIMLGYLKDTNATKASMKEDDGWFRTGDVGVMHPDGYLEIKDRSKDVIISGGENISSVEVESMLYTHPSIHEAAVVAKPDAFWGETPCAFVSLKAGLDQKPSEKEIIEYCRSKLPHYMVPKNVLITEELPKTSTGKIQKFLLRDTAKGLGSQESSFPSRSSRM